MYVARIDSKTNKIINIEIAEESWISNANLQHELNNENPYFVPFKDRTAVWEGLEYDPINKNFLYPSNILNPNEEWNEEEFDKALFDFLENST